MRTFTVHLKLRILLISYTPIQNKVLKIKFRLWGHRRRTSILCRETRSRSQKERNRERELWTQDTGCLGLVHRDDPKR